MSRWEEGRRPGVMGSFEQVERSWGGREAGQERWTEGGSEVVADSREACLRFKAGQSGQAGLSRLCLILCHIKHPCCHPCASLPLSSPWPCRHRCPCAYVVLAPAGTSAVFTPALPAPLPLRLVNLQKSGGGGGGGRDRQSDRDRDWDYGNGGGRNAGVHTELQALLG